MFESCCVVFPSAKGLSTMQFEKPTPIQAACIPVALRGRDLCACAVTGSGRFRHTFSDDGCIIQRFNSLQRFVLKGLFRI